MTSVFSTETRKARPFQEQASFFRTHRLYHPRLWSKGRDLRVIQIFIYSFIYNDKRSKKTIYATALKARPVYFWVLISFELAMNLYMFWFESARKRIGRGRTLFFVYM